MFMTLASGGSTIFPRGGPPTPKMGMLTYYFAIFLPKTAWKWFELPGARVPGVPLDAPLFPDRQLEEEVHWVDQSALVKNMIWMILLVKHGNRFRLTVNKCHHLQYQCRIWVPSHLVKLTGIKGKQDNPLIG